MLDWPSLGDVLVNELPANSMQKPPTDGPVASSTVLARDPEPLHQDFSDVHEAGAY